MDSVILNILLQVVKTFFGKSIDFEKLKIIASTKVIMDRRRGLSSFRKPNNKAKEAKNPLLITLILYAFTGLFIGMMILFIDVVFVSMTVLHSYLLFMMCMTLITDFSTVLLDTTDSQIILPTPVNSRTFFMARVVHILTYLLQFTIALSLFPLIFSFIKYGFAIGTIILLTVFLTITFAVFLTYLLYGLMLRFSTEEKIKQVVSGFQIFMTIFFAVAYQIVPRLINFGDNFTFKLHWYSYLLPPVWMALAVEAFQTKNFDGLHLSMIALSILAPIVTVWVMFKFLAPAFASKIAQLGVGTGTAQKHEKINVKNTGLAQRLSALLCNNNFEQAGFEKVWNITGRDKQFKMSFYPSLAYVFIFGFIFFFNKKGGIAATWQHLHETKMYIGFAYLPLFALATGLAAITFNENYASAWIYQTSPLQKPGEIISGATKALVTKFLLPLFLIITVFSSFIWGIKIAGDVIFAFCNVMFISFLAQLMSEHYLPFSREPNVKQQSGKFIKVLLQFMIIGMVIGAHYFATKISWLVWALIPVSLFATWFAIKAIKNIMWVKIEF